MKQPQLHFLFLVFALAVAAFALGQSERGAHHSTPTTASAFDVLKALPRDASLALTLDFEGDAAKPLKNLLLRRGRELPDVGLLQNVCGYDPTGEIRRLGLALFAPKQSDQEPALAVATRGVFDPRRVADCAKKLVARRGGQPTTKSSHGFQSIGGGPKSMARIAVRPDGLVLLGEEKYLDRMLASAEGSQPSLADNPSHRRLRREVGPEAPLLLSVVLPSDWLARFLPDEEAARSDESPLATVRGAALALTFEGGDAELTARLECTTDEACARLARLCKKLWKNVEPAIVSLVGSGATERAQLSEADRALHFSWRLAPQTLEDLVFQWPALERAAGALAPPPPAPPSAPASSAPFVPDQVIEAKPRPAGSATPAP